MENSFDNTPKVFLKKQLHEIAEYYRSRNIEFVCFKYPSVNEVMSADDKARFKAKQSIPNAHEDLMSLEEQRLFYGEFFRQGLAEEMVSLRRQMSSSRRNGILRYNDFESEYINIADGHRIVPNAPNNASRRVLLAGKCNFFSAYQPDNYTLGYYLQEKLNKECSDSCEVVISSNLGVDEFSALYCEELRAGDIVCCSADDSLFEDEGLRNDLNVIDIVDVFKTVPDLPDHLFNSLRHHDHVINEKIADVIFLKIRDCLRKDFSEDCERKAKQNYYIPVEADICYRRLKDYADNIFKPHNRTIGSIVMNCNPFTKGHRYLIDEALKRVDFLYIFVVQENKSSFSYEDRMRIVQKGVEDIGERVCVLGSEKYIISKETFAQYFDKDHEITYVEDMDYDLRIFGEVVCKHFDISMRFIGEEPSDVVTAKYNETMKRILPEYGIQVVEIPRVTVDSTIVSATKVRSILYDSVSELMKLVPENEIMDLYSIVCSNEETKDPTIKLNNRNSYVEINRLNNANNDELAERLKNFCEDAYSAVYIFGAGKWGRSLLKYLRSRNLSVEGFVVDDEYVSETRGDDETKVIGISNADPEHHKIIMATSRKEAYEKLLSWGGCFAQLPEIFLRRISDTEII